MNAEQCALMHRALEQIGEPCREIIELHGGSMRVELPDNAVALAEVVVQDDGCAVLVRRRRALRLDGDVGVVNGLRFRRHGDHDVAVDEEGPGEHQEADGPDRPPVEDVGVADDDDLVLARLGMGG